MLNLQNSSLLDQSNHEFAKSNLKFAPAIILLLCSVITQAYWISETTNSLITYAFSTLALLICTTFMMTTAFYAILTLVIKLKVED